MMGRRRDARTIEEAIDNAELLSGPEPVRDSREVMEALNREWAFVLMGSRATVLRESLGAPVHDLVRALSVEAFSQYMANRSCVIEVAESKQGTTVMTPKVVKMAPFWLKSPERRTYDGVEFFPDPNGMPGHPRYFNLWRGFSKTPDYSARGQRWRKYKTFEDHLRANICAGNEAHFKWLFAWFAWIIQRPRQRVGTSVVLRGDQGTGKTIVGDVIGKLFEAHYVLVDDAERLVGKFNAHMASCLLLQVDEGFWAGDKAAEGRLKGLITAKKQMIEAKGVDPIQIENRVNVMFSSNESWVVPAGMGERRHAVFDVSSHCKENRQYFKELYQELDAGGYEALLADLLEYDFDAPDAADPCVIPKTRGLLEQKIRSFDPITAWWYGRLENGSQTHGSNAWRPHVPKATCFNDYLRSAEKQGVRRRAAETEFGISMGNLVPGLKNTRRTEDVEEIDQQNRSVTVRRQVRCYVFPSLADCRAAFEAKMHQPMEWEDSSLPDSGESTDRSADDGIDAY
jgi:hypothetical protein